MHILCIISINHRFFIHIDQTQCYNPSGDQLFVATVVLAIFVFILVCVVTGLTIYLAVITHCCRLCPACRQHQQLNNADEEGVPNNNNVNEGYRPVQVPMN